MDGMLFAVPGTEGWHPECHALSKDHAGEPDTDGLQSPWTARGSPSPAATLTVKPPSSLLHWVLPMNAGTKGGEGQLSLALPVQCPASTYHPTSPILMPFRFPETPQDHCHMCHGIPSGSWRGLSPLWEGWAPAKGGDRGDTPILSTHTQGCSQIVQEPTTTRWPAGLPRSQTGRMGSVPIAARRGKQQRDVRGRRERLPAGIGV